MTRGLPGDWLPHVVHITFIGFGARHVHSRVTQQRLLLYVAPRSYLFSFRRSLEKRGEGQGRLGPGGLLYWVNSPMLSLERSRLA